MVARTLSFLHDSHNLAFLGSFTTLRQQSSSYHNFMSYDKLCKKFTGFFSVAKVFDGNVDRDTVVNNVLSPPITTRFIRLAPVDWHNHISMRVEINGCPGISFNVSLHL